MINGEEQAIPLFRRTENIDIDVAKTARVGYDRFKNITNQFLEKNKKTLAIGALGLGGLAVAFQSKPHAPVTADVGRQTLAPQLYYQPYNNNAIANYNEIFRPNMNIIYDRGGGAIIMEPISSINPLKFL
jgi:hypothetical protein